jgi:alkylation response protein AidB-like acyl-CoA dehydrogenase
MDFAWTSAQETLYQNIVSSAQNTLGPADRTTGQQYWTRQQWLQCGKLGLLGLSVPKGYGGQGIDALSTARAIEAFGKSCSDMGLIFSAAAHLFACCMPIVEHGSEECKQAWLPGLCAGKFIGANAITEQDAGSDVFALKTRAILDGSSYILDGEKSFVSNGPVADVFVLYASTNPKHGYFGISCFVVPGDTPGLHIEEPLDKVGMASTPACKIQLKNCRVPRSQLLGLEGQGALVFTRSMQWERACLFAAYLGMLDRQLEQTLSFARQRRQFGKPLIKHQAVAHRLANMKLRLESACLLLYRACWLLDQGEHVELAVSLAKLAVSEAAIAGSLDAIQIHGAAGISSSLGLMQALRDSVPATIFSGTSEMQRDIIAGELGR